MTIAEFNRLKRNGLLYGKKIKIEVGVPPFCLEEVTNEIVEYDGFTICYQDEKFLWMRDSQGKSILQKDCTTLELEQLDNSELEQFIKDAQRVIAQRQNEKVNQAIDEFLQVWQKLKQFDEIKVKVEVVGELDFYVMISDIKLVLTNSKV